MMLLLLATEIALLVILVQSAFLGLGVFAVTSQYECFVAWTEGLIGIGFHAGAPSKPPGIRFDTEDPGRWRWWFLASFDRTGGVVAMPIWLLALIPPGCAGWLFARRRRSRQPRGS